VVSHFILRNDISLKLVKLKTVMENQLIGIMVFVLRTQKLFQKGINILQLVFLTGEAWEGESSIKYGLIEKTLRNYMIG
jgi:hypothetical protein